MQLGLIGLGKMGGNMAERLRLGGHQVVGFDFSAEAVKKLSDSGNVGVSSLEDLAKKLTGRKAVWIMVPQGKPVDDTIAKLEPLLNSLSPAASPGEIPARHRSRASGWKGPTLPPGNNPRARLRARDSFRESPPRNNARGLRSLSGGRHPTAGRRS